MKSHNYFFSVKWKLYRTKARSLQSDSSGSTLTWRFPGFSEAPLHLDDAIRSLRFLQRICLFWKSELQRERRDTEAHTLGSSPAAFPRPLAGNWLSSEVAVQEHCRHCRRWLHLLCHNAGPQTPLNHISSFNSHIKLLIKPTLKILTSLMFFI